MTVFLAILGALGGAILGAFVGFFGYIMLGYLTGADGQQGAIAMGAALAGLPLGAIIGLILGAVLVIRARTRSSRVPDTATQSTAEPVEAHQTTQTETTSGIGAQGWIALGVVAAIGVGFWTWFNWSDDPPQFWGSARPILDVEIRIPADDPDIAAAATRGTDIRNGNVYHGMGGSMAVVEDGDYAVLKARHLIAYKTEDRSVELWLGQKRLLIFNLDLAAKPEEQPEFSDWRRVDHVRPNFYGEDIPSDAGHDIWIRTRVQWRK